jgi:hypothetical protein
MKKAKEKTRYEGGLHVAKKNHLTIIVQQLRSRRYRRQQQAGHEHEHGGANDPGTTSASIKAHVRAAWARSCVAMGGLL